MGLFRAIHDTAVAADLLKAANAINDYHRSILSITNKYGNNSSEIDYSDEILIRGYINSIEDKVKYMSTRMQDIAPYNLFKTMVPCLDGHLTAVPGYVMSILEMVRMMREDLSNIKIV